ncbi:hypothetical protein [Luteitalea sp.]|uniref:hypothetical protein n=1 Tax=Luteitalea sp. TaxID=2004800 RepID=UPI0025BA3A3A|nr:hypothetical protein [Luteitalea sp.]
MIKLPNIQDAINAQLSRRGLDQYVDYVTYLPADAPAPDDATHILTIASAKTAAKVQVAIKAKGFYGQMADVVLGVL